MPKLSYYFDKRSNKETGSIKISVYHKRRNSYIKTNIFIPVGCWDDKSKMVVNHPQGAMLNAVLMSRISALNEKLYAMMISGDDFASYTSEDLRDLLMGKPLRSHLFLPAINAYRDSIQGVGTRSVYKHTIDKIREYLGEEADSLTFEDITHKWLTNFDRWMSATMSINSRSIDMRNIRAVFNRAITDEVINFYPFRKFKIKHEATRKRSLTIEQLRDLRDRELPAPRDFYRDYFMLTFYLIGINTADLLPIKKISPAGRIDYKRAKTKKLYSIKVEPEALAIIEKYKGVDHILAVGDKYPDTRMFLSRLSHRLRKVEGFEFLSSYWARHTWATIAAELDIPKETIAAALGHGGNSVTDIYIRFDQRKVDAANRRVIDYLNSE